MLQTIPAVARQFQNRRCQMILRFRLYHSLLAVLLSAACSEATQPRQLNPGVSLMRVKDCNGPAKSLDPAIAATLPPRTGSMRPDDEWADLAQRVPGGFAGVLYINGKPVLMLTDPSQAAAAKAALAPAIPGFAIAGAAVHEARGDFSPLVGWYKYLYCLT